MFAPNSNIRAQVSASQRGKNSRRLAENLENSDKPYHARSIGWAEQRVTNRTFEKNNPVNKTAVTGGSK